MTGGCGSLESNRPVLPVWSDAQYFAIFSDIHANEVALKSTFLDLAQLLVGSGLNDPRCFPDALWQRDLIGVRLPLAVWVLGDSLDAGPRPSEVLNFLETVADVHIYGNHEQYLHECIRGVNRQRYSNPLWRYVPWTIDQVGCSRLLPWLERLTPVWRSPEGWVDLVHGTHAENDRAPAFTRWDSGHFAADEVFEGPCAHVTFSGHSHLAGIYQLDPKAPLGGLPYAPVPEGRPSAEASLWVNAGSVGYPFLSKSSEQEFLPYSVYVVGCYSVSLRRLHVQLRRVPYPLGVFDLQVGQAGVLEDCAPYASFIYLQSVLNRSIVFQAFRWAREKGYGDADLAFGLAAYFSKNGLNESLRIIREAAQLAQSGSAHD
jgi:hypothetical protein